KNATRCESLLNSLLCAYSLRSLNFRLIGESARRVGNTGYTVVFMSRNINGVPSYRFILISD
ncbi:hypothetical protein, partial [Vibrio parahaemolyticus]|uniref:hypothetical protein n=1 Tax=Vibrio parahaemolyticus TaxID=670 RepID=UPI001E455FB3